MDSPTDEVQKKIKKRVQITSSGRTSKTPKRICTTSEDETPIRKKNKTVISVEIEKNRLRKRLEEMKLKLSNDHISHSKKPSHSPKPSSLMKVVPKDLEEKTNGDQVIDPKTSKPPSINKVSKQKERENPNEDQNIRSGKSDEPSSIKKNLETVYKNTSEKQASSTISKNLQQSISDVSALSSIDEVQSLFSNVTHQTPSSAKKSGNDFNLTHFKDLTSIQKNNNLATNGINEIMSILLKLEKQGEEQMKQPSEIKQEMKEIRNILLDQSQKNLGDLSLSDKLFEPLDGFPLTIFQEFENLNCKTNTKLRKSLYHYLKNRGGAKLREFLHLSLKITMSDHLVSQFTWLGDKDHKSFENTRVSNVFFMAAKNCPWFQGPRDKSEFKTEMKEVLRTTKQRHRYSLKKIKSSIPESDTVQDGEENFMTVEEIEEKLIQLDDNVDQEKDESEDYDADKENFEESGEDFEDEF